MRLLFVLAWLAATAAPVGWLIWRARTAFGELVSDPSWQHAYGTALLRAAVAALLAVALACPAAVAIAGYRFSGRRLAVRVLLLARLTPPLLLLAAGSGLLGFLRPLPEWLRVPIAHLVFGVPVAIWLISRALSSTPQAAIDLARSDGLSLVDRLRYLLWPQLGPALLLAGVVCFVASFSELGLTIAITGEAPTAIHGVTAHEQLTRRAAAAALALAPGLPCGLLVALALRRGRQSAGAR